MKDNWEFGHAGACVRDFDTTMAYYQSLGIAGRVGLKPTREGMKALVRREFGRIASPPNPDMGYKVDLLVIGDLTLEVLQLQPRKLSIAGDYLVPGEGINHICFNVSDIVGESLELCERGSRLMLVVRRREDNSLAENYLDTREFGNIVLSLRPDPDGKRSRYERSTRKGLATNNWRFRGHSVIVFDVDKAAEYYEFLGLAAARSPVISGSSGVTDFKVHGKTPDGIVKTKVRTGQIGPTTFEFVEPLEGESIYKESLAVRGEGIFDITFTVDDLETETAGLVEKGVPVILSGTPETGGAFAYFDTRRDGGDIAIKLVQGEQ